jgi:hypothetical protein
MSDILELRKIAEKANNELRLAEEEEAFYNLIKETVRENGSIPGFFKGVMIDWGNKKPFIANSLKLEGSGLITGTMIILSKNHFEVRPSGAIRIKDLEITKITKEEYEEKFVEFHMAFLRMTGRKVES